MPSKRPDVNKFSEEFSGFYHETIDNYGDEAFHLGKCERQIYSYGDRNEQTNNLKAHEIPFSTKANEILLFLLDHISKKQNEKLNGEIDDEWSELASVFAECRLRFRKKEKINYGLKSRFLNIANNLFSEWETKGSKP